MHKNRNRKKVCEVCGKVTDEKTLAKVEHKWVDKQKQVSYLEQGYIMPGDKDVDIEKKFGYDIRTETGSGYAVRAVEVCVACNVYANKNKLPYYDIGYGISSTAYYCGKCNSLFYSQNFDTAEEEVKNCNGKTKHQYDYNTVNLDRNKTGKFYGDSYTKEEIEASGFTKGHSLAANDCGDHVNTCPHNIESGMIYAQSSSRDHFYKFIEKEKTVTYQACSVCGTEK